MHPTGPGRHPAAEHPSPPRLRSAAWAAALGPVIPASTTAVVAVTGSAGLGVLAAALTIAAVGVAALLV